MMIELQEKEEEKCVFRNGALLTKNGDVCTLS